MEDNVEYAKLDFTKINPSERVKLITLLQEAVTKNRAFGNDNEEPLNQALLDYQKSLLSQTPVEEWGILSLRYDSNLYRILKESLKLSKFNLEERFTFNNVEITIHEENEMEYMRFDFTKVRPSEKSRLIKILQDCMNKSEGEIQKKLINYISSVMPLSVDQWEVLSLERNSKPCKEIEKSLTSHTLNLRRKVEGQVQIAILPGPFDVLYLEPLNEQAKEECARMIRALQNRIGNTAWLEHSQVAHDFCIGKNTACNVLHVPKKAMIKRYLQESGLEIIEKDKNCYEAILETGGVDDANFRSKSWDVFHKNEIIQMSRIRSKSLDKTSQAPAEMFKAPATSMCRMHTGLRANMALHQPRPAPPPRITNGKHPNLAEKIEFPIERPRTPVDVPRNPAEAPRAHVEAPHNFRETAVITDIPGEYCILHLDSISAKVREAFVRIVDDIHDQTFITPDYYRHITAVRNYCVRKKTTRNKASDVCNIMYFKKKKITQITRYLASQDVRCVVISDYVVDQLNQSGGVNGIKLEKRNWTEFCNTADQQSNPELQPPAEKRSESDSSEK